MKVAIVHDWLTNMGGAERVISYLHSLFPTAPIYTLVYNEDKMDDEFKEMDIRTSFLQKIPFSKTNYQKLLPLMPLAVEQFDFSEYDLVISSSTSVAKGIITNTDTVHICYCNTPMRYAWDMYHFYRKDKNPIFRGIISIIMNYIRIWDRVSADRVDYFIANSNNVAKRIKKHYRRESKVIYPPVNTDFYTPNDKSEDFYLVVSRLVPYKRIDIVIKAFNQLGLPLKIIGDGSEFDNLKNIARDNIEFKGRVSDQEVRNYYRKCKAFIFPGEEDFGITPVEAQACGKPVIAYGKGGVLETIIDGETGKFFYQAKVESLLAAVKEFEKDIDSYDSETIRNHAFKFSRDEFKEKIINLVEEAYKGY
ncbi:glycosyltransferase family 4 protein [Orenia marismortui]|uniref:Glycosyltransferase involved in cell wall biosynthesis n=1 Tax=Orenia marismortui TaxID=46469 RepID=A0A4R8HR23_9FIRM|nr:glycosyltransferase family 4 protein [Orenia marismortui]TDX59263.1 glycosyltransferase involved in cell wall biosynthesis [Orenia marismortui]